MPYVTDIDQFCPKSIHVIAMKKLLEVIFRKKNSAAGIFFSNSTFCNKIIKNGWMMPYDTDIDQFCPKFIHVIAMKKLLEVIFRKKNRLRALFFQIVLVVTNSLRMGG